MKSYSKLFCLALLVFSLLMSSMPVSAITQEDLDAIYGNSIFYDPDEFAAGSGTCSSGGAIIGSSNAEIVWNYLRSRGLNEIHTAGFMGNFAFESGFDPTAVNPNGGAYGLAQWLGGRQDRLYEYAAARNADVTSLALQLDFVWFELTGEEPVAGVGGGYEASAYQKILATTTVRDAAVAVDDYYERSEGTHKPQRIELAEDAYATYSDSTVPSSSSNGCNDGLGVGIDGFVFPMQTNKRVLQNGSLWPDGRRAVWCYDSLVTCHGHYPAADIFAPPTTRVVASVEGRVSAKREAIGGVGSRISVYNSEQGLIYYYTHMKYNSLVVEIGQQLLPGDYIGQVGEAEQAVNTAPHLHFDITKSVNGSTARISCKRIASSTTPACDPTYIDRFIDPQPFLVPAYNNLPE